MRPINDELHQAIAKAEALANARAGFLGRAAALEHLEWHVFDRLVGLAESPPADAVARAEALRDRLETTNEAFWQRLRHRIATGRYTPAGLRRAFGRRSGSVGAESGYDGLDWLVGGLLDAGEVGEERETRQPDMVFYQPTPARAIAALISVADIRPEDVVVDLGAGLGHVVILVALLSGARATGIEVEPAYCEYAEKSARRLNAPGVHFICADAREAPLSEGTVFFMYTPFRGALLNQVLARLQAVAARHPIRVATYGPCTAEVAASAPWLIPRADRASGAHGVIVFSTHAALASGG